MIKIPTFLNNFTKSLINQKCLLYIFLNIDTPIRLQPDNLMFMCMELMNMIFPTLEGREKILKLK